MQKEYVLEGLDCANCASKIEAKAGELKGTKNVSLNFITKVLKVEIENTDIEKNITFEIKNIVNSLEPHVKVKEIGHSTETNSNKKEEETFKEKWYKNELTKIIISAIFFAFTFLLNISFEIKLVLYLMAYLLSGGEVLLKAGRNIVKGQIFDENFLMSIATIGAFAIGEYPEAVAVMLFYQTGEFFQSLAVNRSRKSIADLMDIRPDFANLKIANDIKTVSPEEVKIGDIIVVKPGEKIPLDGKVIEGSSMVDTSALTGESVPREVEIGDNVLGGFINSNGLLTVEVEKEFGESTVSKILDLVENASSKKAPTENFITKFARYYTPIVVFGAVGLAIIPPLAIEGALFSDWVYRALVFLIISCPCALVVSIPLGFFGGIGGASRSGILVKGSNYLEALNNIDTVVFDKTGTLTKGVFKVTKVSPENNFTKDDLLEYAAYGEVFSNHPIAISIVKAYGKSINKDEIKSYEELSGHGIKAVIGEKQVLLGNSKLMDSENIFCSDIKTDGTIVHVAVNHVYAGNIIISDEIKDDSARTISELKKIGIRKTVMLTGDRREAGGNVGKNLGLDFVYSELLPDEKVAKVEELSEGLEGNLVFVGDGINDAPVLARADIGIAMGGLGSDAAIEAADVVLMTDEPSKLVTAIKIAKQTRKIVVENIILALGIKAIVLLLGALGVATLWEAVFADVGVTVLAVLNSMRAIKVNDM